MFINIPVAFFSLQDKDKWTIGEVERGGGCHLFLGQGGQARCELKQHLGAGLGLNDIQLSQL